MNHEKIGYWVSLTANLGVLIGIVAVVAELQQTQVALTAESSNTRSQTASEIGLFSAEIGIGNIQAKLSSGESLSELEDLHMRQWMGIQMRYFENMHFQSQLGVLDEEIWQANLSGIRRLSQMPGFDYANPDWPNSFGASIYRSSFVDLIESFRD